MGGSRGSPGTGPRPFFVVPSVPALLSEFSGSAPVVLLIFFNIVVYIYHHFWLRQSKTKTRGEKKYLQELKSGKSSEYSRGDFLDFASRKSSKRNGTNCLNMWRIKLPFIPN